MDVAAPILDRAPPFSSRKRVGLHFTMSNSMDVLAEKRAGFTHFLAPLFASGTFALLAITGATPGKAALVTQTFTTTETFTGFVANSTGTTHIFPLAQFSAQPFDDSLGTLTSSTIAWAITASFSGVAGNEASVGTASFSLGGSYWVGDDSYAANGSDGGNGSSAGNSFSIDIPLYGNTTEFLTSEAGSTYNSDILASFLGGNDFLLSYGSSTNPNISQYSIFFMNVESGSASITTTATLTFDYEPVPGPLPLLGIGTAWGWSRRLRRRCSRDRC